MYLIEGDPAFSRADNRGFLDFKSQRAGDWFVLIDGTHVDAVYAAVAARFR